MKMKKALENQGLFWRRRRDLNLDICVLYAISSFKAHKIGVFFVVFVYVGLFCLHRMGYRMGFCMG